MGGRYIHNRMEVKIVRRLRNKTVEVMIEYKRIEIRYLLGCYDTS